MVRHRLDAGDVSDITLPGGARAAGVSVRTVYRHFPTREDLLGGASEWIGDQLFGHRLPDRVEDLAASLRVNFANFDEHPNLVRSMALTRAGNLVRSPRRQRRLEHQRRALLAVTDNLPDADRHGAEAVFGYLGNMLAWVTMRDENGLSGAEMGRAMEWALTVLIDDLRRRNEAAGAQPRGEPRPRGPAPRGLPDRPIPHPNLEQEPA